MVEEIRRIAAATALHTGRAEFAPAVLTAMAEVPRHRFVAADGYSSRHAYDDTALPIACRQTISQPYMVALMSDLLDTQPTHCVLEVGTGSGYQAAVLSRLVRQVYSVEVIAPLAQRAQACLHELGYDNVEVGHRDGYEGWPEHAPYDGIMVTAAVLAPPPALLGQLNLGARLVIPIGAPYQTQMLTVMVRTAEDSWTREEVLPVSFVPFTRNQQEHAQEMY